MRLTATLITRDAAGSVGEAIRSVRWADEVVVVDSGSTDGTPEVARSCGARVVVEGWRGYGAQKNRAASLAGHDWVLSLDADERVDDRLAAAIAALPARPLTAAYTLRRRNRFAGRVIPRWPWSCERVVRLYDRRRAAFVERRVHETLRVDGPVASLPGRLEHFAYRDWDDYRRRQQRYVALGAEQLLADGRRPRSTDLVVRPAAAFLRQWFIRGGLLGGGLGWRLAVASARGTADKYRQLRRLAEAAAVGGDGSATRVTVATEGPDTLPGIVESFPRR